MKAFSLLSIGFKSAISTCLFLALTALLILILYQIGTGGREGLRLKNIMLFIFGIVLLSLSTAAAMPPAGREPIYLSLPWAFLLLFSAVLVIYSALGIRYERRIGRDRISPFSIKLALDNLGTGILFSDEGGRTVLLNRSMEALLFELMGKYPGELEEIREALLSPPEGSGVERLGEAPYFYRFRDGRIYRILSVPLIYPDTEGFIQTSAYDVSEVYEGNIKLREDNEALRVTNEKLRLMYERLADRIREEEALNLKMRVHNDIGVSLIALSELLESGGGKAVDRDLETLQNAVSFLSGRAKGEGGKSLEAAIAKASEMKLSVLVDGSLGAESEAEEIVSYALSECCTNLVRHAGGKTLFLQIEENDAGFTVTIKNDGKKPEGEIREGGGLSSVRKKLEDSGGSMRVLSKPEFALILELPRKRNPEEDDIA